MSEIFNSNQYQIISEKEYNLYQKEIEENVFNILFKKGETINLINSFVSAPNTLSKLYKLNNQQETFLGYELSHIEKERLVTYFGKKVKEEKFSQKNEYFQSLLNQITQINNLISPVLSELGIEYEMHLTGGALRDYILNQSQDVKDLDILIEFHDKLQLEKMPGRSSNDRIEIQKIEIDNFFIEKQNIIQKYNLNINSSQSREKIFHEIILQSVNQLKSSEIKNFLLWNDNKTGKATQQELENNPTPEKQTTGGEGEVYDGLFSVIKIKGDKFKYPMDLLLNSNKHTYLNNFDFNICKSLYTFKSLNVIHDREEDSLYLYEGFIKDVIFKKLTLNSHIFMDEKQVDRCLKDHYLRLKKKYPEYEIEILESNCNKEVLEYIKKAHLYYLMDDKLSPKDNKIKKKKI